MDCGSRLDGRRGSRGDQASGGARGGRTRHRRPSSVTRECSCTIGPMAVPGRVEAAYVLLGLDPPEWFVRHSAGVAEVASFLAARAAAPGRSPDPRLAQAARLLPDVGQLLPPR